MHFASPPLPTANANSEDRLCKKGSRKSARMRPEGKLEGIVRSLNGEILSDPRASFDRVQEADPLERDP